MAEAKTTIAIEVLVNDALKASAQLTASQRELAKVIRQELGASLPGAKRNVDDLAGSFRNFRKDQVQEGRLVGFFVRELTDFAGVSKGAQAAMGGLAQGAMGLATATGPLMFAWAGFEVFKAAAGYISDAGKAAEEETNRLVDSALKLNDAVFDLKRAFDGFGSLSSPAAKLRRLEEMKAGAEGWEADAAANPGDMLARNRAREARAQFERLGGERELGLALREVMAANVRAAADLENKEYEKRQAATKTANEKALDEARRFASDMLKVEADRLKANAEMVKLYSTPQHSDEMAARLKGGAYLGVGAGAELAAANALKTPVLNVGSTLEGKAAKEQEQLGINARKLADSYYAVGDAVGMAAQSFAMLGAAVGGAAGEMVGKMMAIVMAAVKMAIAIAAASAAEVPLVGWLMAGAAAVGLAATLMGVIGGVEAREFGGPVRAGVPYLVGERGPELFVPGQGGGIMAAGSFGGGAGNVTVNISAVDGASVYAMLRQNSGALVRVIREAVSDRRL